MTSQATGNLRTTVARNIKAARDDAGLTQKQLAQRLGDGDPQVISKWERGEHAPSLRNLTALALALGCDVAWFYTDHERKAA